jgi:large subunit ribosomal protein L10e
MAALRKASTYSKMKVLPYTRISRKKNRSYIKVVPPQKIVKFTMGNSSLYNKGAFPHLLTVFTTEDIQIRHNALEAVRQNLHRRLDGEFTGQYYFKVVPFPHHIQRENKMLTGAGADRMQTGMQLSFGKCVGKAALLKKGQKILFLALANEKMLIKTRGWLKQVKPKLPCHIKIGYEFKKPIAQQQPEIHEDSDTVQSTSLE